jgi:hypothetical protein
MSFMSNELVESRTNAQLIAMLKYIKTVHIILFIAFAIGTTDAQDVVLERVQRGDDVVVFAENKSAKAQFVMLDLMLSYVTPDRKLPVEVVVKPGEKKELIVLSPIPLKAWSYKTRYSFEEYIPGSKNKEILAEANELKPLINVGPRIPNNEPPAKKTEKQAQSEVVEISTIINAEKNEVANDSRTTDMISERELQPSSKYGIDYFLRAPENTDDAPMPAEYARRTRLDTTSTAMK